MPASRFELIAAPHTAFDESGELALEAVVRQANHLHNDGVQGVLVAGSTGEGPSLTGDERRGLAAQWVQDAGPLQVIVQVGHDSVAEAAALARHAADAGAAAICAAPPSWFRIERPVELIEALAIIAAGAPALPFFYYHIPVLSGVALPMPEVLVQARARIPNFAGVKYTHPDAEEFATCVRDHGDALRLWWGTDEALTAGLAAGAHGAVGSSYNFAAPLYRDLIEAFDAGDRERAQALQGRSVALIDALAAHGYAAAAKAVMALLGVDCGPVRSPLRPLDAAAAAGLREELTELGFFGWLEG